MSAWDLYAVCPGCDRKYIAPFGNTFHLPFEICPHCGEGNARRSRFVAGSGWRVAAFRVINGRFFERSVATPAEIDAAEQMEAAKSRRGCLISVATVAAICAAALFGGLDFTL